MSIISEKMLRRYFTASVLLRRNISALFVTGDKAKENFAVLSPVLNFDERMNNFQEIKENIRRRKLIVNFDDFKSEYELYTSIKERKKAIEDKRVELYNLIKESPAEADALKIQAVQLREDLKQLTKNSYHLEDSFVKNYLCLPNFIHERTPESGKKVIYSFKNDKPQSCSAIPDELIEFYDPTCYYMKGEAAKFDLFMPMHVLDLHQDKGFTKFSNPDFTRSVIAEGGGVDTKDLFLLKEDDVENKLNLLHLTGSGSFLNYLSFVTKLTVFKSLFPLKYICSGKQYDARNHFEHQDLYRAVQATCCQSFVATADESTFDDTMSEQIKILIEIFERFDLPFNIVYYPANQLAQAESCRVGVEMFSPSQNNHIEVANFSYYGDYISKRLLFNFKIEKDFHFPHIFSGTVNIYKLLLVLIENSKDFKCPKWLQP